MKQIYLDNYKGYNQLLLSFKDVNFFVGENSSGKTALLSLINILTTADFWFTGNLNNDTITVGYFNELINKNSTNQTYFRIGVELNMKHNDSPAFHLFTFVNKKGNARLSEYKCIIKQQTVVLFLNNKSGGITYSIKKYADEDFVAWINDSEISKKIWKLNLATEKTPFFTAIQKLNNTLNNNIHSPIIPFMRGVTWIAPIRAKAQRYYENFTYNYSPEGLHTPVLLKSILQSSGKKQQQIIAALNKFGKQSALFDGISIEKFKGEGAPFEIDVTYDKTNIKLTNVGYGVSQIMPVLIEILTSNNDRYAIQQPEVHLHPKAQAAFGELIYTNAKNNHNKFYIETHSDFTINRFRYCLAKDNVKEGPHKDKPSSQVVFFERKGTNTSFTTIPISQNGKYDQNMPEAYGCFFIDEELKVLDI